MNNLLKTTVYLILLSLASQLYAQQKIAFFDKDSILQTMIQQSNVDEILYQYQLALEKEVKRKIIDINPHDKTIEQLESEFINILLKSEQRFRNKVNELYEPIYKKLDRNIIAFQKKYSYKHIINQNCLLYSKEEFIDLTNELLHYIKHNE